MKTFILNAVQRLKKYSQKLDAQAVLYDKSWDVFNETGDKELMIFRANSELLISRNGIVQKGKWELLDIANMIIDVGEKTYLLNAAYIEDKFLALKLDGTEQYMVMIEADMKNRFSLNSVKSIENYLEDRYKKIEAKEQAEREEIKRLEAEKKAEKEKEKALRIQATLELIKKEKEKQLREEEERKRNEAIEREREENLFNDLKERAPKEIRRTSHYLFLYLFYGFLSLAFFITMVVLLNKYNSWGYLGLIFVFFILLSVRYMGKYYKSIDEYNEYKRLKNKLSK